MTVCSPVNYRITGRPWPLLISSCNTCDDDAYVKGVTVIVIILHLVLLLHLIACPRSHIFILHWITLSRWWEPASLRRKGQCSFSPVWHLHVILRLCTWVCSYRRLKSYFFNQMTLNRCLRFWDNVLWTMPIWAILNLNHSDNGSKCLSVGGNVQVKLCMAYIHFKNAFSFWIS